jgi:hypothetical protein
MIMEDVLPILADLPMLGDQYQGLLVNEATRRENTKPFDFTVTNNYHSCLLLVLDKKCISWNNSTLTNFFCSLVQLVDHFQLQKSLPTPL